MLRFYNYIYLLFVHCGRRLFSLETDTGVTACSSGSRKTPRTEGGLRYIPTDYHHEAR